MKFLIEKNKNSENRVTINISKITIQKKIFKRLNEISKNENINGFRKGKIPINIIQKKYGDKIYYDVLNTLMQKLFNEFTQKEKIEVIGSPKYYIHPEDTGDDIKYFKYSVIYASKPIFQIQDIELIHAKKIIAKINKKDILKQIEKDKRCFNAWKKVNRSIKMNDRVLIDYQLYIHNQIIQKFNKKDYFIVSKDIIIPQLYFKIINKCINDVFFIKIKFSKFHPEKILQNQDIILKIKIITIEEKENRNVVLLKNNISALCYKETEQKINRKIKKISDDYLCNQIIEQLIKANPILIPGLLIEQETQKLFYNNKKRYKKNKGSILEKKYHINIEEKAKKNVHISLIFQNIITTKKLLTNSNTVDQLIKKISINYQKPSEIINLYKTDKYLIEKIKNIELEMQVMQLLLKTIKIKKEHYTLDEAIYYTKKRIDDDLYYTE
ncbi:trigger factor [Buchnera aphidicola]|uniref:trigger factor n=1 Tax=Buchnera aphidicola TaxID=9 RepID=UPI003464CDF6